MFLFKDTHRENTPSYKIQGFMKSMNINFDLSTLSTIFVTLNQLFLKGSPGKHSSWWRHLENVLKRSFVFVFRKRHKDVFKTFFCQDEYISLSHTSSEDVFKTSCSRQTYSSWPEVFKTSSRRFKTCKKRLEKTSSRHLQDILKTSCKNVFKKFSRRFAKILPRCFQDVSSS